MNHLEQQPEEKRHYSIENYRASTPQRLWVEPTQVEPTQVEIKQRHDAVMARLHREAQQWRKLYRVVRLGYGAIALCVIISAVFSHWLRRHYPGTDVFFPIGNTVAMIVFLFTTTAWNRTTKEMAASADVRDIGAFIEALQINITVARPALVRLLPELRASDGGLLQEHHRQMLRRLVGSRIIRRSSARLVASILKAYEQIGVEDDIPVVEKLAAGVGYGKYKQVHQAAKDCLPALRIVAPQHREQVTLLRASSSHYANTADLVRPAQANSEGDPNEMLRASIVEARQP